MVLWSNVHISLKERLFMKKESSLLFKGQQERGGAEEVQSLINMTVSVNIYLSS